jgi:acyl-CoA reductase-like NAD-dependent aldehyde dehydrogenase
VGCQSVVATIADQCRPVERAAQMIIAGKTQDNVAICLCAKDIAVPASYDQTMDRVYKRQPIERLGTWKEALRSEQLLGELVFDLNGICHGCLLGCIELSR